jgi:sulfatase maturation enzyme AslB (radical SAM superfamily)
MKALPTLGSNDPGLIPIARSASSADLADEATVAGPSPQVPLQALDQLWFQVAGTVCNLRCTHCFISCSPENHSFWFMSLDEVVAELDTSVQLGVKEYYFTGGEPFMNREMVEILEATLALGPATILTNATLIPQRTVDRLAAIAAASPYTLELRVSIDGCTREMNDAIRGEGSFDRALAAVGRLAAAGFLPIITTMQTWPDTETDAILSAFRELLRTVRYEQARLKILPPLRIGGEAKRDRGYERVERVTEQMMATYPEELLLCSSARLVTSAGVWACPILLDYPSGKVGSTLEEAVATPARLAEQACYTCWVNGAICSNTPGVATDFT